MNIRMYVLDVEVEEMIVVASLVDTIKLVEVTVVASLVDTITLK